MDAGYTLVATLGNQDSPSFILLARPGLTARIDSRRLLSVRDSMETASHFSLDLAGRIPVREYRVE